MDRRLRGPAVGGQRSRPGTASIVASLFVCLLVVIIESFMVRCATHQDFRGVIQRSKAVILVAEAMPELAALDFGDCTVGRVAIPVECHGKIAFMRVWCLVRGFLLRFAVLCVCDVTATNTD